MLIIDQLQKKTFTESEKKIVEFILAHLPEIKNYTIYDIAKASFTSTSTVSRFCKKTGAQSFKDFQLRLSSEINNFDPSSGRIEYNFPIQSQQESIDIILKVKHLYLQTLNDTVNTLDIKTLNKIANLLLKATSIEIFAEANSFATASNLYNKLIWLEIKSNIDSTPGNSFLRAKTLDKESIVVIISYYGKSETLNRVANYLIDNNIKFILLTGPAISALQKKAYYSLSVPPAEDKYKKIASIGSDFALNTLIDILIMLLYNKKISQKNN